MMDESKCCGTIVKTVMDYRRNVALFDVYSVPQATKTKHLLATASFKCKNLAACLNYHDNVKYSILLSVTNLLLS